MKVIVGMAGLLAAVMAVSLAVTEVRSQDGPATDRPEYTDPGVYSASEAVRSIAEAPMSGLSGQFAFVVKGWARDGERVFLNSEADYRDAGTLTVALSGPAVVALTEQLGGPPDRRLIGRTIVVAGVARRVRIDLLQNGRPTGQFYSQTHVPIDHADQVYVVPGPALPITANR